MGNSRHQAGQIRGGAQRRNLREEEKAMIKELFTCKEVAARYNVSEDTVWRWVRTKKLPAVKIGCRNYRVRLEDLIAFEESQ